jgi:predicted peroxiredoxin
MQTATDLHRQAETLCHPAVQETLVVMLTSGNDDGGKRATLAYTAATCAAAMDKRTIMFLVGDGAHWAYEGRTAGVKANGFPALNELMESLVELGGEIYVCSACDQVCSVPSDNEAPGIRRHPAIRPLGMSAVLADMSEGRCVTF